MHRLRALAWAVVLVGGSLGGSAVAQADQVREHIRLKVDELRTNGGGVSVGPAVVAGNAVARFYERRDFRPVWVEREQIRDFLQAVDQVVRDGLDPRDYGSEALRETARRLAAAADAEPAGRADLDIRLTHGLSLLVDHLSQGKVDPGALDRDWNFDRPVRGRDRVELLESALAAPSLAGVIAGLRPQHRFYVALSLALEEYRAIEAEGGWPAVSTGPSLKAGIRSARLAPLRARLLATGDLSPNRSAPSDFFDDRLEAAVLRFQRRHGLDTDGIVGPKTLAELNVPVSKRIDQMRLNLERARWVLHGVSESFIAVNIAAFEVFLVRNGEIFWRARAVVGRPYRKTPLFTAAMTYLVFNPTWTVPPGILAKDILPKVKADPGFLREKKIDVLDLDGRSVDPGTIAWVSTSARGFPYLLRQKPGPHNALGRVKFMFPNRHLVYLHDTPNKELFERADRTFSSGCIRVENSLRLARLLLEDNPDWQASRFEQLLESPKTTTVSLQKPVPVLLLYWTAWVEENGVLNFRKDTYNRDAPILARLNRPLAAGS
jgi:murein L,D-transpeptidase YcbB/YkuD